MEQTRDFAHGVTAQIRLEAERQGIRSQSELARRADMPVATVRRYFYTEEREPTVDALATVAAALGVSASEIFLRAERAQIQARPPKVKRPVARRVSPKAHQRPRAQ